MELQETKEFAQKWIEDGRPCQMIYGLEYRGARPVFISKEAALALLPIYRFGMGFHELSFVRRNGEYILRFSEYSENDLY